jgi:excisionase family DNA binding protein
MTKRAAAEQLSISLRHLENLIHRERIPVVHLGRSVRLAIKHVDELARRGA